MYDWIKTSYTELQDKKIYTFDCRSDEPVNVSSLEASHLCIQKIIQDYPPPYTLYLSGGVDSQAMLYAWHTSGVPYKTFSARFENDFNNYDLQELETFAKCYNIDINYQTVPVLDFFENEHSSYANEYWCGSPQITYHMKLLSMTTEGTCIMSGELLTKSTGRTGLPHHNNMALFHYRNKIKPNLIPFFFFYTKELAHSCTPQDKRVMFPTEYHLKCYLYHINGFPVISQNQKYTGFEKIKEYYDTYTPRIITARDRIFKAKNRSTRNFDVLYRNRYESKFTQLITYRWVW